MSKYAGVIINSAATALDKAFTYSIPEKIRDKIEIGSRVLVGFGNGNRKTEGFVISLSDEFNINSKTKEIYSLCDDIPLFTENDLVLIEKMRKKYLCSYIECIKVIIPSGITRGVSVKSRKFIYLGNELSGRYQKEPYKTIWNEVKGVEGKYTKNSLSKELNFSISSISSMIKHGYLIEKNTVVNRYDSRIFATYEEKKLTEEQKQIVENILNANERKFLIHGVTGSGKTEIYMQLASKVMQEGKSAIILVPEISLTPQMVERFKGRFGNNVSVFHSKLSLGERFDEWFRIKEGKVNLAIGARSAVFLPFENLGMIIIDEEHESSYKSDGNPKYDAREIAEFRSEITDCKIVLGSATPSIESYYKAMTGEIKLFTLEKRVDGAKMPEISIVDMRKELESGNRSIFSRELLEKIQSCLGKNEQIILFLNRRGFSTFVSCRKCGYVYKCESCDISLTYHSGMNRLVCHYCGKSRQLDAKCPACGSKYIKYFGLGTEKVETEIKKLFPNARTLRMDFDTTRKKDSYENIYNKFKNHEADILIGTQMVAKGHDFKNVTLVGIIAADLSLNLPDYRSAERTFQLITQVSGRAGRGSKSGNVVVQTYNPENRSICHASKGDYSGFIAEEIELRRNMNYPPFSDIMCVNMNSPNEELLIKYIQNVGIILKNKLIGYDKIDMLGPNPCIISKIKDNYRWQLIFKGKLSFEFAEDVRKTIYDLTKDVYNDIRISIDINPSSLY